MDARYVLLDVEQDVWLYGRLDGLPMYSTGAWSVRVLLVVIGAGVAWPVLRLFRQKSRSWLEFSSTLLGILLIRSWLIAPGAVLPSIVLLSAGFLVALWIVALLSTIRIVESARDTGSSDVNR
jgi:hypothetical protein